MAHIFSCASHPTSLTARDLWDQNCSLVEFLPSLLFPSCPLCPSCRGAPHTTAHIFSYPSRPTSLTVRDLWDQNCSIAEFLPSLPFPFTLHRPLLPKCTPHHGSHLLLSLPTHFPNGAGPVGPKLLRSGVPPAPSFPLHTPSAPSAEVHPTPRLTSSPVPPNPLP